MPHYNSFTKNEIQKIKALLDLKIGKSKSEQLNIRNELRDTYGFYISDFRKVRPYTSEHLEMDIRDNVIEICTLLPEFDNYYTGWPKDICSQLNISAGQYKRRYKNVKVGITNNPRRRFNEHLRYNPEMHWQRMVVKYMTTSINNANEVEKWFIENRPEFVNQWVGKSNMSEEGPYYAYFLLGELIE